MRENKYFESSDAWVFVALFNYNDEIKPLDLKEIIARGDWVNHSIFTSEELCQGFEKLISKGLIELNSKGLLLTKEGCAVKEKITNGKGGIFSMVENTLRRINSPKLKLRKIDKIEIDLSDILSNKNINEAYKDYSKNNENK